MPLKAEPKLINPEIQIPAAAQSSVFTQTDRRTIYISSLNTSNIC